MMTKLKTKTNKKGFTVIELVMVVALIAILAAIAIPTVSNVIGTANENVDKSNAQTVEMAIKTAYAEALAAKDSTLTIGTESVKAEDLTVTKALKYKGIATLPDAKVSGAKWGYKDGKIYLNPKKDSDGIAYPDDFNGMKVKEIVILS